MAMRSGQIYELWGNVGKQCTVVGPTYLELSLMGHLQDWTILHGYFRDAASKQEN